MRSMVVYSHRRWSVVRQRPQQLMSRLAGWYDIRFVEEPVRAEGTARLAVRHVAPGVTVLVPHTPVAEPGFNDRQLPYLRMLLSGSHAREHGLRGALAWLYTPMALPLAEGLGPSMLVYDCMEDLATAADAPPELAAREAALLQKAGLVFAGGPSLYESRRRHHPRVHCLPSAVDAAHFSPGSLDPADLQADQAAQLQQHVPGPRLGYFGVIDERIDLALLAGLADARPQWSLVMVGPVERIDPARLPQRPNIHWLGQQPYARLPYLLAGWDLCLMPFAINASTAAISPAKTLEFMAGEKPIVSTPVPDVALLYGHVVRLAHGVMDVVAACEQVLAETPRERSRRVMDMLGTVSAQSWDRCAATVHGLVERALGAAAPQIVAPAQATGGKAASPASAGADTQATAPPLAPMRPAPARDARRTPAH